MYLCGPTLLTTPHIGQMRSAVSFDVLHRWLRFRGFDVTLCRNLTDIEDKIIARSIAESVDWWRIAEASHHAFTAAYRSLGCLPPTVEPRATGHIPEVLDLIAELVDRGHAYATTTGVYFNVASFPGYGALSRRRPTEWLLADGGFGKRAAADFALWKAARPEEPYWSSPWGRGRPGWHIECSAMAGRYLGPEFDIHAGGRDLLFPHHENEIAQSRAGGRAFARYWLHNGQVNTNGEKIRKSPDNPLSLNRILADVQPTALRYYFITAHYHADLEFSITAVRQASSAFGRVARFVERCSALVGMRANGTEDVPAEFAAAMDDDLSTPAALRVLHGEARSGNRALATGDREGAATRLRRVDAMLEVLGLRPQAAPTEGSGDQELLSLALECREAARARGDYALADRIRTRLAALGVVIEDGAGRCAQQ